jgi:hypothetical protein
LPPGGSIGISIFQLPPSFLKEIGSVFLGPFFRTTVPLAVSPLTFRSFSSASSGVVSPPFLGSLSITAMTSAMKPVLSLTGSTSFLSALACSLGSLGSLGIFSSTSLVSPCLAKALSMGLSISLSLPVLSISANPLTIIPAMTSCPAIRSRDSSVRQLANVFQSFFLAAFCAASKTALGVL